MARGHSDAFLQKSMLAAIIMMWCFLTSVMFLPADQTSDLDAPIDEITNKSNDLSVQLSDLTTDQAKAFTVLQTKTKTLEDQTHLTNGILLVGSVVSTIPGGTFDWPITLLPGTFKPAALQTDIFVPIGFTVVSVSTGPAAVLAGKQMASSMVNGLQRILIFGFNQTVIGPGVVAIVHIKALPAAVKTQYPLDMINHSVSDATGNLILSSIVSGTVEVK